MARKPKDREEATRRFQQAIAFTRDVRGDPEAAADIEAAGLDAWLESKGWGLENPSPRNNNPLRRGDDVMSTILLENPATGEFDEVDLSTLDKPSLLRAAEQMRESLQNWEAAGSTIGDAIEAFEAGEIDASDLADDAWEALSEIDPEEYPPDDEAEGEEEQAAA
jgi:hypothetical protein